MTVTFAQLKQAYKNAVVREKKEFDLDDKQFVTGYAKYLIEYLEMQKCPDKKKIEFTQED